MPGLCRPVIESGRIAVGGLGGTAAIRIALLGYLEFVLCQWHRRAVDDRP
jgi:hypothetical protein